jgi:hypothetical protein
MISIESKTGTARGSQIDVYHYLSDFRNFSVLLPPEYVARVSFSEEIIRFDLPGLGQVGFRMAEKLPFEKLTVKATEDSSARFTLDFHISPESDTLSKVQIILEAHLNMLLEMMAKGMLQQFADLAIDRICSMEIPRAPV